MRLDRILVTGFSGYVGPWVLSGLRRHFPAARLIGAARHADAETYVEPFVDDAVMLDLRDSSSVDTVVTTIRPDAVVHLAGLRNGDLDQLLAVNVLGFRRLLVRMAEVAHARIIVVGSAAEIGRAVTSTVPLSETVVCEPVDNYGVSKLAQSGIAKVHALHGQSIVRLRVFNLIGPTMPDTLLPGRCARLLHEARSAAGPVHMEFGSLSTYRDYIDVRDVAEAVCLGLSRGKVGALYHIGSGVSRKGKELVEDLIVESGVANVWYESRTLAEQELVPWQAADIRHAQVDLNWTPKVPWCDSLRDLLESVHSRVSSE